jgi:glycerol-3-phosphate dehydrogenase
MSRIQTEVLVIGGGATGTGTLRDLAMRGFKTVLVEKGDLTHGTTGRYHGLLHSGGRYVVRDPQAAIECIEENRILRSIMSHCIEDTGGYFVLTPWDDPDYAPKFVEGCRKAGIPIEDIPISRMLKQEPSLNPDISICYRVPDASADSFLGADCNAESARQYGATWLNYHKVIGLLKRDNRVIGARCKNLVSEEDIDILADIVVNASGAWAGQIAAMAGADVHVIPGKGVMLAVNHRIVNTVINRCKFPSDGDILVPAHTVAIIGTTDVKEKDPDKFAIETWEVELMLEEGEKIIPGFRDMRMLRAWAGVRPLYQESDVSDTRDVTRAFVLLDHTKRDGIDGIVTITSGKWTTYRKMAEVTVDLVCEKLNTQRECKTHKEVLPSSSAHQHDNAPTAQSYHYLGERLAHLEKDKTYGQIVCECELATYQDVKQAILNGNAKAFDDIRRDVRLGMGPCQGGFCTYRLAGIFHEVGHKSTEEVNVGLRDFLQERWKGMLPVLWGQQLRQERLNELIYLSLLNANNLPGPRKSAISPETYLPPQTPDSPSVEASIRPRPAQNTSKIHLNSFKTPDQLDVLVVGMGLAGLTCAWRACQRGLRTRVIAKGHGALYWHTGCIDLLGFEPNGTGIPQLVKSPRRAIEKLVKQNPGHPYSLETIENIETSLHDFQNLAESYNYPMRGSIDKNWLLPTALGTLRPTCLAPETMVNGDCSQEANGQLAPMMIVGIQGFLDFYPNLIAANLTASGISAIGIQVRLPALDNQRIINGRLLAEFFEKEDFRSEVCNAIKDQLETMEIDLSKYSRLGLPAVLGLRNPISVWRDMQNRLGIPIFEIPTLPPSVPGIRLSAILQNAIEKLGGQIFEGMQVIRASCDENMVITTIWSEAAAREKPHYAKNYVLATGGILGGGISTNSNGSVTETAFGLPVEMNEGRTSWLQQDFMSKNPHPIFETGLVVDKNFQPIKVDGKPYFHNLYAVGTTLAGADYLHQCAFDGVAVASGLYLGKIII